MKTSKQGTSVEAQKPDIVELGVATVETKGGPGIPNEEVGRRPMTGISDQ